MVLKNVSQTQDPQDMIDAARSNTVATTGISSDKFDGSSASVVSVSADNITVPNHGLVTGSPIEYSFGMGNTTITIASATLDEEVYDCTWY